MLWLCMGIKNFEHVLLTSVVILGGCTTTLEHRTPVDIASNSVQINYPDMGVSEILAPPVKTFRELRSKVAGMAQLRTAGPFTDKEGTVHNGGAYLDVLISYTSATPDPLETRQYSQARWPDGEIAQLADFGASVLDCRADTRNVRRFPFGNGYYGAGYYNYGYGNFDRGPHNRRGRYDRRRHHDQNDHTDYNDNHADHDRARDHADGNNTTSTTEHPPVRPPKRRRTRNEPAPQPDGPGTEPEIGPYFNPGSHPYASSGRPQSTRQPHSSTRGASSSPRASSRAPSDKRTPTQASQYRTNHPKQNTTNTNSHNTTNTNSHRSNTGNTSNSGNNSSNQHKSSTRLRSGRHLNYYPTDPYYNPGYVDTVVRRYCARQENLRVFVPRKRLDAAKTNGISLLIRSRGGREEVLNLPPNYITGFMLAAWTPEGRNMTIPGYPLPRPEPNSEPQQETLAPMPNPKSPVSKSPSPKKPIIYGEN